MARPHTGQLGAHNHSRRVPNSIRQPTSSHLQTLINTKKLIQKTRSDYNSKRAETKQCHCTNTCRRTLQRFLLESLFGLKEGGYLQTSIKPKNLKQAGVQTEIPHGVHSVGGDVNDPQLFHGQGRPSGCLLACTHQEGIPTISTVHGARGTLPIQGSSFRPFHGTPSVHENTQPIDCTPQASRNLSHTLSGRPPNQSSVLRPESQRHPNLCHNTPTTRLDNKLQKKSPHTHTANSVFGNVVRLIPSDYISALGEDSNNRTRCSTSLHSDHHFSGTLPPVIRLHVSSIGSTAFRQIPHERLSESLSTPLGQEPLKLVATNSTYHASQTFTDLVDNTSKSFSRQDMGLTPVDRTDHGHQPHRLGGNLATSNLPRDMVPSGIKTSYKRVGNQSNPKCHSSLVSRLTKHATTHSVRQCHRSSLPQQAGGNPQQQSDEGGSANTHLGRTSCSSHLCSLYSGRTKLGGGLPQPPADRPGRVVSPLGRLRAVGNQMGKARHRHVCVKTQFQSSYLLRQVTGPEGGLRRRISDTVDFQASLCLPSTSTSSKSDTQDTAGTDRNHSHCPGLAAETLVLRTHQHVSSSTMAAASHTRFAHSRTDKA
ncbi:uncharacterized protein LOC121398307 [Xenopus laevis]|uniref:Uncharacterized protein LOC121398307 n=1 Tax=Xenopus laevis TaxID=8355 RepID=A0A8J1LX52_XENLA|nr:uncharacterized protein LOC121398307 [Xenopus laevis]